jgi:hypothetical protein
MVTEYEAAKLRREMHKELDGAYTTLLKCAVGIIVLVTLAIVSPTLGVQHDDTPQTASTQAAAE